MKSRRKINRTVIVIITSLVFFVAGACHKGEKSYTYETAIVKKGSIINTITATGTVEADTTVLIGTQVSGVIKKIYVDFNSNVKKGQLLAELDKKLVAQADYDQVKYSYDKAKANLKTAQAGYDKAIVNLNYASIYSPIIGVVLNRAVDQGQTVAASFSTPNLFTIGNDLTQMQVQANVDEADIGQVRTDQPVSFTVDAYPNETFKGSVRQIRLQPVVTSNVVTYTVIVNAPNPEKKLMPGMTANITVLVQKIDSVLTIPGKALRFTPDAAYLAEYMKNNPMGQRPGAGGQGSGEQGAGAQGAGGQNAGGQNAGGQNAGGQNAGGRPSGQGATGQAGSGNFQGGGQMGKKPVVVWVKTADKVHRTRIATGAVDGSNAEVKWGLKEGDEVILSMTLAGKSTAAAATPATTTSPFMPTRPGGARR